MRFRKLRIAWSVVWGVVAVLLIALWVRSYWWLDSISYRTSNFDGTVAARQGEAGFLWIKPDKPMRSDLLGFFARSSRPLPPIEHPYFVWGKKSGLICAPIWLAVLVIAFVSAIPW